GKRALVLGCGGGQDMVALARMGAYVSGIDASANMLEHADALLNKENIDGELVLGTVSSLSFASNASFDLVVSVHALTYVEHIDRCFAEAHRVLVPDGILAFSVHHPIDASTYDSAPYAWNKSYFQTKTNFTWLESDFTSYHRTVTEWFAIVRDA